MTVENRKARTTEGIIPRSLVIASAPISVVCEPRVEFRPPPPILREGVDLRNEAEVLVNGELGMVFAHGGVVYELLPPPNSSVYEGDGEIQRTANAVDEFFCVNGGGIAFLVSAMCGGKSKSKAQIGRMALAREEGVFLLASPGRQFIPWLN